MPAPSGKNIRIITDNDLCIGCGACRHACPYEAIQVRMQDAKGFYEPVIADESPCLTCTDRPCLAVCPSYEEDFVELAGWTDPKNTIGPYTAIYTGHSTDDATHRRSSSGGMIREICRYSLETKKVDGIITLRHAEGLDYEPSLYRAPEELDHMPASIYHSISFEGAIELLKTTPGNFLLIATPCQLTSIRKWMNVCPDQQVGRVVLTVGLICGWMFSRHSLRHLTRNQGLDFNQLQSATYRGGDKTGNLVLRTPERTLSLDRRPVFGTDAHTVPFKVAFSRTYNNQRCLLCIEHINYLADIVVGDAWLKAFAEEKVGSSIVITRNEKADEVVQDLLREQRVALQPGTVADVMESQSADLARGTSAQQLAALRRSKGHFAPKYTVPDPASGWPGWYIRVKNDWLPRWFRKVTWNGWGYAWYRVRCADMHLLFKGRDLLRTLSGHKQR